MCWVRRRENLVAGFSGGLWETLWYVQFALQVIETMLPWRFLATAQLYGGSPVQYVLGGRDRFKELCS
ncbi:hypothetical protein NDN08_007255 [Rhodosorus marinus]|uniref:Uncharacterized protein n=1 Tax=Rhodosorus marinus TaxID=101924 RepID=A0AAV8UG33_9RHOD|nr:hypothetical protein NDN08_007255 [Rhodosorus marinus]